MIEAIGTRKGDFFCSETLIGGDARDGGGRLAVGDARCDGEASAGLRGGLAVGGEQRPGDGAWEPRGAVRRLATWCSRPPSSTPVNSLKKCYQAM